MVGLIRGLMYARVHQKELQNDWIDVHAQIFFIRSDEISCCTYHKRSLIMHLTPN